MLSSIVAASLGVRAVVLAGRRGETEVEDQLRRVRARLGPNTTVVLLDPEDGNAGDDWLLAQNPLYRKTLESLERKKGGAVLQVCEGTRCEDVFDMSDMDKVLEELGG